jgi:hypothetical protein
MAERANRAGGRRDVRRKASLKKPDDELTDIIREERSRGRKRPIDTAAVKAQTERNLAVLEIFRVGTREDLRALLKAWNYSQKEIEAALSEFDAARRQQSF